MRTVPQPRATVIIGATSARPAVDLAIESVFNQTIDDLEIIVLGVGVDDATRELVARYWRHDERVRFMDLPAAPDGGALYLGEAVRAARGPIVGYLSADALFLPDHVDDMLKLLATHPVARDVHGWFRPDGTFELDPGALRRTGSSSLMTVSGLFHVVGSVAMPPGVATDDVVQLGEVPEIVSSGRVTTVHLPTDRDDRDQWSAADRRAELERWATRAALPAERQRLDAEVARVASRRASELQLALDRIEADRSELQRRVDALQGELGSRPIPVGDETAERRRRGLSRLFRRSSPT